MAKLEILAPFILSYEGGFVDHPLDRGGVTNKGVTLKMWRSIGSGKQGEERNRFDKNGDGMIDERDLKRITEIDVVELMMRPYYWDAWRGDELLSQSIANILVDWVWGSGRVGIVSVQKLLGLKADGIVGPVTLKRVNEADPEALFSRIKSLRKDFLNNLIRRQPSQKVFMKGWMRRLDSIGFGYLCYNGRRERVYFADHQTELGGDFYGG